MDVCLLFTFMTLQKVLDLIELDHFWYCTCTDIDLLCEVLIDLHAPANVHHHVIFASIFPLAIIVYCTE